jgi:hypothetical protein
LRYSNCELFNVTEETWNIWLDDKSTPRQFFTFCIERLELLIELSLVGNWMDAEADHLRNYRLKSIEHYRLKLGEKRK